MLNFLPGTLLGRGRPDFTQPPLPLTLQKVCNHVEVISAQIPWAFECVRKLLECSLLFMLIAKAFRLTNCSQILSMLTPSLSLYIFISLSLHLSFAFYFFMCMKFSFSLVYFACKLRLALMAKSQRWVHGAHDVISCRCCVHHHHHHRHNEAKHNY